MVKKKRIGLTQNNIIQKDKYKTILLLILSNENKNIRFIHLKYALVNNNNYSDFEKKKLEDFFYTDFDKKTLEFIKEKYESKMISYDDYVKAKNHHKQNTLRFVSKDVKFNSIYGLRKALKTLKDFNIIESVKPKKGYSYYSFTDIGLALYMKQQIHHTIDNLVPNNYSSLKLIHNFIFEIIKLNKKKNKLK